MSWLRKDQHDAIRVVSAELGWDCMPVKQVGLLMWCAFHYYVMRLNGLAPESGARVDQGTRPRPAGGRA